MIHTLKNKKAARHGVARLLSFFAQESVALLSINSS